MWVALSLIALFIGYCWYDGFRASMDRLLHGSHTLALKGESMRRASTQP